MLRAELSPRSTRMRNLYKTCPGVAGRSPQGKAVLRKIEADLLPGATLTQWPAEAAYQFKDDSLSSTENEVLLEMSTRVQNIRRAVFELRLQDPHSQEGWE